MTLHEYAPERVVRLVNDPLFRAVMWFLNRTVDDGVLRYRGDATVEVVDYGPDAWGDYERGQAAALLSIAPTLCYTAVIAFVGMNPPGGMVVDLLAIVATSVPALVSINDVCNVSIEYQNVDEGEIIGRARTEEVSGA